MTRAHPAARAAPGEDDSSVALPGAVGALRPRRRASGLWLLVLAVVLTSCCAASVALGSRDVAWADIVAALKGSTQGFDQAAVATRIPRTALAVLAGSALALSGAVMQGVTRNPLADPGILGVNTGASLAVVVGLAQFGLTSATTTLWVAIAGAAVAAVAVYAMASLGRDGATPLKLALAGAASSAALASLVTAIVLPRSDIGDAVQSWQIGGVGGATTATTLQVAPFLACGALLSLLSARGLNTLALGDDLAAGLGERVALTRGLAALGAVVLCGATTAVCGPIAFVGLVVPHACRLLVGPDHRWLLPFSAVAGATLLVVADIAGRLVARPAEIDVGIITALIGAPLFIAIVRRTKVRAL